MSDFPIAPIVGYGRGETAAVREFIPSTEGVEVVRVPLSRGKAFCLVDRADWIKHELWRWCWTHLNHGGGYAYRNAYYGRIDGQHVYRIEYMHRLILGVSKDQHVDHRNRDSLDNRRANLRPASQSENVQNQGIRRDSTTGIRGVCFVKRRGDYAAYIEAHGVRTHLGYFQTLTAAATARDASAIKYHGEFAALTKGA